jgi:hypothetical protein
MKIGMFVALIVATALILPAASAQTPAILDMVISDQSPYPVNPGQTVTIEVQIQNTGYAQALDRTVEIVPKDPFTLLPGEEREKTVAIITPRGYYSLTYRLGVSSTAPTNSYPVDFRIYTGADRSVYAEDSVDINVEGEANLVLEDLYTNPETLEPGAIADLIVKVKNIGTGAARDLQLTLNSSHDEIKTVLAKGKVYVGDMAPGETKTATLGMSVDSTTEEKTYNVLIYADYKDESNTATTDSFSVGLPVKGTINLDIIKKEASFERSTLRIEVANKGTTEAKSLEAKFVVDGENVGIDYISSLKANKKTTFEFPLVLTGSGQLVMDYIGPGIEKNQVVKDIVLDYQQPSGGNGTTTTLVVVVVVIIIVYFLYRKFFKKKKPHHHKE